MDITDQLEEVRIFLAHDRLITVLEKMAHSMVDQVESHRIACQQSPHQRGELKASWKKQKVKMVGDQRPRVAESFGVIE
jgi:hypothetical protein